MVCSIGVSLRKYMSLNVHFGWGHRMIEKEDSPTGQSQGPAKKRNKGVPPEEQNLGLPDEQIKELSPQPVSEVSSISAQQELMIAIHQRDFSCL